MSSPQQVAESFQHGAAAPRGLSAQAGGSQVSFSVTGTAAGATTKDQASFFNRDSDTAIDANYALATVAVTSSSVFTAAETGAFQAHNPSQVANVNVVNASASSVISSMSLQTVRFTPAGEDASEQVKANAYQTAKDFQTDRVQFPIKEILDGYTFFRLLSTSTVAAATYDVTVTLGPIIDKRLGVPQIGAKVINT